MTKPKRAEDFIAAILQRDLQSIRGPLPLLNFEDVTIQLSQLKNQAKACQAHLWLM
jgi:hypothetical protein